MRKNENTTQPVLDALRSKTWRDPGPDAIRQILGENLDLPDIELFPTAKVMERVKQQIESGGYVDDPEFCMIRSPSGIPSTDNRLVFDRALFIAGSIVPGDDVFVVADGNIVRVFDWCKTAPDRWVGVVSVEEFVDAIASAGD